MKMKLNILRRLIYYSYNEQENKEKLIIIAESLAKEKSDYVSLSVGLNFGYSSAQRMYVKRGYIPDRQEFGIMVIN